MGCDMTEIKDGNWTLWAYDTDTGRSIWSTWIDGKITFKVDTPVSQIIEANTINRNADQPHRMGEFVRIASLPLNEFHERGLAEALSEKDDSYVSRWLNDSDNAAWRTREGNF